MEIRKQILGIAIGFIIAISFITPAYSKYKSSDNVCNLTASDLKKVVEDAVNGCIVSPNGQIKYCSEKFV